MASKIQCETGNNNIRITKGIKKLPTVAISKITHHQKCQHKT